MNERLDTAYGYLKSKGYSDITTSGIVGSIRHESGEELNTTVTHDGGTRLGIAG